MPYDQASTRRSDGPCQGKVSGRPGQAFLCPFLELLQAMPPAYMTTCSSCRSRIASKKLCLTLPAGILLQCLEDNCSDEFIGQRLSLNPHSPVSSLSLGGDLFLSLCYVSVSAYILRGPHTRLFVQCLSLSMLSLAVSFHHPSSYCTCYSVQPPVITIICTIPICFLFLIRKVPTSHRGRLHYLWIVQ